MLASVRPEQNPKQQSNQQNQRNQQKPKKPKMPRNKKPKNTKKFPTPSHRWLRSCVFFFFFWFLCREGRCSRLIARTCAPVVGSFGILVFVSLFFFVFFVFFILLFFFCVSGFWVCYSMQQLLITSCFADCFRTWLCEGLVLDRWGAAIKSAVRSAWRSAAKTWKQSAQENQKN